MTASLPLIEELPKTSSSKRKLSLHQHGTALRRRTHGCSSTSSRWCRQGLGGGLTFQKCHNCIDATAAVLAAIFPFKKEAFITLNWQMPHSKAADTVVPEDALGTGGDESTFRLVRHNGSAERDECFVHVPVPSIARDRCDSSMLVRPSTSLLVVKPRRPGMASFWRNHLQMRLVAKTDAKGVGHGRIPPHKEEQPCEQPAQVIRYDKNMRWCEKEGKQGYE